MESYEHRVQYELSRWKHRIHENAGFIRVAAKRLQNKLQSYMPRRVQEVMTSTIKNMMTLFMSGSVLFSGDVVSDVLTLHERDALLENKLNQYKKISAAEGAGTGAGGLLLGMADFPLLLGIKIRFLVDAAKIYGFSPKSEQERLFMLYIFQLAFSSDQHRKKVFDIIENWEEFSSNHPQVNWEDLQQEYRDHIDFAKLLQLVPIIGAPVGAYVNYQLLEQLGETAKNAYRLRYMKQLKNI